MFTETIHLKPLAPFSFDLSATIFSRGDRQIRNFQNDIFRQVIRIDGKLVLASLSAENRRDTSLLKAELTCRNKLDELDEEVVRKTITKMFNLDLDLIPFYETIKLDAVMQKITRILRGLRSPTTQTVFEALIDAIIEQQISLKVAASIEREIIKKFGDVIETKGNTHYAYPTPETLASAANGDLYSCGLSGRKAEYIKEISNLVTSGTLDLEKIKSYSNTEQIIAELDSVRCIDAWTAELTVIRSMQKWDVMPADDLGLRRIIAQYYCEGEKISGDQVHKITEPWGKWKGLAAFYLVIAEMLGLKPSQE
jgi:DNA-3-methyladenine glycosylase II